MISSLILHSRRYAQQHVGSHPVSFSTCQISRSFRTIQSQKFLRQICLGHWISPLVTRRHSSSSTNTQGRLAKSLYRQSLRWCQDAGYHVPLSAMVPPVTLHAPTHIDETILQTLLNGTTKIRLPTNTQITNKQITVPIHTPHDAKLFFQAVFRMNADTSTQYQKQRLTVAFQAIKSLNEMTDAVNEMKNERKSNLDREGAKFCIGQVVQHNTDQWRGVVMKWRRSNDEAGAKLTSLTAKEYKTNTANSILYRPIIDVGDLRVVQERLPLSAFPEIFFNESDLSLVQDPALCRIRSQEVQNCFVRFDAATNAFVPNNTLAFLNPVDEIIHTNNHAMKHPDRANELGRHIVKDIQHFASHVKQCISNVTPKCDVPLPLVTKLKERLTALSSGQVLSNAETFAPTKASDQDLAVFHLRSLVNMTLELSELMYQRQIAKSYLSSTTMPFALGDIVVHLKFGFRGVVTGWDPKPKVDVSRWDGLTDIENPNELPFYHIVPDQSDCVEAFGWETPFRYVCEKNLELCPRRRSNITLDLDDGWVKHKVDARYTAPDEVKFKYGEDLEDDGVTEECFTTFQKEINEFHISLRNHSISCGGNLLEFLQFSDSMEKAGVIENMIKEVWKAHADPKMRKRLDHGVADLLKSNHDGAMLTFSKIVNDDPTYAEAWNKLSTCQFIHGDMQSSLDSANKTLELIPNHFQALNGLGLIQYETKRFRLATESFRRSLHLNPWSQVSTALAACVESLRGLDMEGEASSSKGN